MIYTVLIKPDNPNLANAQVRAFIFKRSAERFARKVGSTVEAVRFK